MAVAIDVFEVGTWPPRTVASVSGLTVGDAVSIYRSVAGVRTPVRGALDMVAASTEVTAVDAELPFGVPVTYVAVVNATSEHSFGPTTYALPGGKVAVSDAIGGGAAEVVVTAWPSKQRERVATTYVVGGRNVVVSGALAPSTSTIEVFTETETSRRALAGLLESATSGVVQIRQPGAYSDVDGYYAITRAASGRYSQDGTDERRRWDLSAVEVEGWPAALTVPTSTYADVAASYSGLTYAALADDFASYLVMSQGSFDA